MKAISRVSLTLLTLSVASGCGKIANEDTREPEAAERAAQPSKKSGGFKKAPGGLEGRVIAVGIPGASAIAPVGTFLPGGPIHDNPTLAAFTTPGRILDAKRIIVGNRSNFGAAKANADQRKGSFLSIDPTGAGVLSVPAKFAAAGDQATTLGGAVQMYTSQSANFRNGFYTPTAVTANQVAASNPLSLAVNNAFGRLWPGNAPYGLEGPGTSSIVDPDGRPLKGAPNAVTGGVYFDDDTNRLPTQIIPGKLGFAPVGTAFLGASPDGSTRAVFVAVLADGAIVQEHTGKALDGLAPPGTVEPLIASKYDRIDDCDHDGDEDDDDDHDGRHHDDHGKGRGSDGDDGGRVTPRLGALVSYDPTIELIVSQPSDDSIKIIGLTTGGPAGNEVFMKTGERTIRSKSFDQPVDLAPVEIETADKNFSSNTTMAKNSKEFYVANRGDNTIVRVKLDGTVVSKRRVRIDGRSLGDAALNGIATSPDHTKIWVTYTGRLPGHVDRKGGVIELPSF